MTFLNLITINNEGVNCSTAHYYEIMELFENNMKIANMTNSEKTDEGFILIDYINHLIINNQCCFSLNNLSEEANDKLRDWKFIDLGFGI